MSQSVSQAAAFFRDVSRTGRLWTVRDAGGYPAPRNSSAQRARTAARQVMMVRCLNDTHAPYRVAEPST